MTALLWAGLLGAATLALLLLPLLPALLELVQKKDAAPLRVVRAQDTNVRHFALSFRNSVNAFLTRHDIDRRRPRLASFTASYPGAETCTVLGTLTEPELTPTEARERVVRRLLLACGDLRLAGELVYEQEVFAGASLWAGARATLRAAYAEDTLTLAAGGAVARWAHAGTALYASTGVRLYGRVSCNGRMHLAQGAQFERVHAPMICFGSGRPGAPLRPGAAPEWTPPPGAHWLCPSTCLIEGDFVTQTALTIPCDLIVRGRLQLAPGTRVEGRLKAHSRLQLGTGSTVLGAIVARRLLRLDPSCLVRGPVISEETITIGTGTIIGTPRQPTTVTAARLRIADAVQVSGTVWARESGRVDAAPVPVAARDETSVTPARMTK